MKIKQVLKSDSSTWINGEDPSIRGRGVTFCGVKCPDYDALCSLPPNHCGQNHWSQIGEGEGAPCKEWD